MGIMEKKMDTTIVYWGLDDIIEQMIVYSLRYMLGALMFSLQPIP